MADQNKKIIVAVSGGFDPVHVGHVRLFQEAKALGDELVVILNNDNWLRKKKRHIFMSEDERREIIEALQVVDRVIVTEHEPDTDDMSVCSALLDLKPHIFANGGDRLDHNVPEVKVCNDMGCKLVFNIGTGGKVQSSSWLLENYVKARNGLLNNEE